MKKHKLPLMILLCSSLVAKGQSISLIPGNDTVCPCKAGFTQEYEYSAASECSLYWEFSPASFYQDYPSYGNYDNQHTKAVRWSTPTYTFNAASQTGTLPRGKIKVKSGCNDLDTVARNVVLLSVKGLFVSDVTIGNFPKIWDNASYNVRYNDTTEISVSLQQINYPNTTKKVTWYEWSIPKGWKAKGFGNDTIFLMPSSILPPQNPNIPPVNSITVTPNKCSGGTIKVRPVDYFCSNHNTDSLKGNWFTINVYRTPKTPSISINSSLTTVLFSEQTPISIKATGNPSHDEYKWEAINGFLQTGFLPQTSSSVILTHVGCSTATVKTRAMCENEELTSVLLSIPVKDQPTILGSDLICVEESYTLSTPNLRVSSWSVTEGFTIASQNTTSVTVRAASLNKQTGTLSAIINGCLITKNIQACDASDIIISGPEILCPGSPTTIYSVANFPTTGATITWTTGNYLSKQISGNQCVLTNTISTQPPKPIPPGLTWNPPTQLQSWVKAEIRFASSRELITTLQKDLTINKISISPIEIPFTINTGEIYIFRSGHNGPAFNNHLSWSFSPFVPFGNWDNNQIEVGFGTAQSYTVTASIQNGCGLATQSKTFVVNSSVQPPCLNCPPPQLHSIVYPNPASGTLYIDLNANISGNNQNQVFQQSTSSNQTFQIQSVQTFDICLYDKHGNIVRQQKANQGKIEFNVSNLPKGTYFLHIESNGKIHKEQIIIEK
ncbi:MAG: T9SS type A sorting domain-containing protein [Bacteroidales bacterium]|jgi:hypothetical protein|nr:T9SS type A sorting domain-containing protein [Bacteroidales bacterium]